MSRIISLSILSTTDRTEPRNVILTMFFRRRAVAARSFSSSTPRCKQLLVTLGSGWGGYNTTILWSVDKKRWGESDALSV